MKQPGSLHKLAAIVAIAVGAPTAALSQPPTSSRIAWLQGCWATVDQDRIVEEQWMAPRGQSMFGTSRSVQADKVVGYEYMMIRDDGSRLSLEVRPSGKPAVVFVAGAVDESSVVFENAKHAFPQRIGYRKDGPNAVLAWIEGNSKSGAVRHVDFRYRQVACAGH